ncbi:MAG: hypothetical protein MUE67_05420 [Anaerolineales bacterium]|nr:hypothetical protein [Anaerolineales bacterium]
MPELKNLTPEVLGKLLGICPAPVETLCRYCDPASLGFQTTDELPDLQAVIGQPRASKALELGYEVSGPVQSKRLIKPWRYLPTACLASSTPRIATRWLPLTVPW